MNKLFAFLLSFLALSFAFFASLLLEVPAFAQRAKGKLPRAPFQVIGYYTEWSIGDRHFLPKNLADSGGAEKLTVLNYAFATIQNGRAAIADSWAATDKPFTAAESINGIADNGNDPQSVRGVFGQFIKLKRKFPQLKILLAVGGGGANSAPFSAMASTPSGRSTFITSCINTFLKGDLGGGRSIAGLFDGIDIDWEYPTTAADTQNFTALITELRQAMNVQGVTDNKRYYLSFAASADLDNIARIDWKAVAPLLDYVNLMAYDFHGTWENTTMPHSSLFPMTFETGYQAQLNGDTAVEALLKADVPARKIILGIPMYGRGWRGVAPSANGLRQMATGAAPGTYEAGFEDFRTLKNLTGYQTFRDETSRTVWLYSPSAGIFWGYDDAQTVAAKSTYARIKAEGLGGVMFWELSGDDADATLLKATIGR